MDVHPVRHVRHVVSAPHTPRSVPRLPWSSSFLCCGIALLTDPFGIEPPAGQASRRQGTPFLAAPLLLCLAPSLTAALPRRRAALSLVRPSPSVHPSVHPSLPLSLPPYSLSPPSVPRTPPPSLRRLLARSLAPSLLLPSLLPSFLPPSFLSPSLLRPSLSLLRVALVGWRSHFEVGWSVWCSQWPRRYGTGRFGSLAPCGAPETRPRRAAWSPSACCFPPPFLPRSLLAEE